MAEKKHDIKLNVIMSYLSFLTTAIIGFILYKFKLSYLGDSQMAVITSVYTLIGFTGFLNVGLGATTTKYVTKYRILGDKQKETELVGISFLINIVIAILAVIAGIALYFWLPSFQLTPKELKLARAIFGVVLFNTALVFINQTLVGIVKGYKKFNFFFISQILMSILKLILIFVFLKMGEGGLVITICDLIIKIIQVTTMFVYTVKHLDVKIKLIGIKIDKDWLREIMHHNLYILITAVATRLFWKSDPIILLRYTETTSVTHYINSSKIIAVFMQLSVAFSRLFLPVITEKIYKNESRKDINNYYTKASKYLGIILGGCLIGFLLVGQDFIRHWLGRGYEDSYRYAAIVMTAIFIPMTQGIGGNMLIAYGKHRIRSFILILVAVLNIVISILLVQKIGIMGVVIGTATGMIIGPTILLNIYYHYEFKLHVWEFFTAVFLRTLISMGITAGAFYILFGNAPEKSEWFYFFIKAAFIIAVYGISSLLITLKGDPYIKKIVSVIKKKITR